MAVGSKTRGSEARYRALVDELPPRPIHSEAEYDRALARVEQLLGQRRRSAAETDYLDILAGLVESWEEIHHPIPDVSATDMIRFLLEQRGEPQRALVPIFGTESIVSEVLSGKRELQRKHIEGLSRYFHVSPSVFFPDARRG